MPTSLLDAFRVLSSFGPPRQSLAEVDWSQYVDWSIAEGTAPLAAYNLEYRLGGAGAPAWAREQLLSVYQGSVNDNVMKLVQLKRTVGELEGRKILVLAGASFAEALYPHIAFRPVADIELLVRPGDVEGFAHFLESSNFKPAPRGEGELGHARGAFTDGRTEIYLFAEYLGADLRAEEESLFARALPMRVYGSSFYRPDLEDALLLSCLTLARQGFVAPALWYVDLRELFTGATSMAGPYSRKLDFSALAERARRWNLERALYVAASLVERLFPDAAPQAARSKPDLRPSTRKLLDRWVVSPAAAVEKMRTLRGSEKLRRFLTGGRR
jgi:hypothetical protein